MLSNPSNGRFIVFTNPVNPVRAAWWAPAPTRVDGWADHPWWELRTHVVDQSFFPSQMFLHAYGWWSTGAWAFILRLVRDSNDVATSSSTPSCCNADSITGDDCDREPMKMTSGERTSYTAWREAQQLLRTIDWWRTVVNGVDADRWQATGAS